MVHKSNGVYDFDIKAGLLILVVLLSILLSGCQCKEDGDYRSDVKTLICK